MELTERLLVAVSKATEALAGNTGEVEGSPLFTGTDSVGKALRQACEENRQSVDLLEGWIKRACKELAERK